MMVWPHVMTQDMHQCSQCSSVGVPGWYIRRASSAGTSVISERSPAAEYDAVGPPHVPALPG